MEEELKNVGFTDADEPVPTLRQVEEQEVEALVDCEYSPPRPSCCQEPNVDVLSDAFSDHDEVQLPDRHLRR